MRISSKELFLGLRKHYKVVTKLNLDKEFKNNKTKSQNYYKIKNDDKIKSTKKIYICRNRK
jgi:hypothetical protein